jgi:hypothetical protein
MAETPAKWRARIIRSEAVRKPDVWNWTNIGARPPPKLAPYVAYATGVASFLRRGPWSLTPPPASAVDEDNADSGRVIGPEDFVKEPAEEEHALAEALAKTTVEEAERRAALRAVEAF